MSIKQTIKRILPSFILKPLQRVYHPIAVRRRIREENKLIAQAKPLHEQAVERVRKKEGPLNVVFFALMDSVWKYDVLYRLMEKDPRFNPIILVCPVVNYGRDNMLMNMERCYNLFKSRGYTVIRSYDSDADKYVDVREELKPDIIFYTNPYKGLIDDRYYITNFKDTLTCYTSYAFPNSKNYELDDTLLHNMVWRRYVENRIYGDEIQQVVKNKGINFKYSGYSGFDTLMKPLGKINDPWKNSNKKLKRIIWAPHHTITDYVPVKYSTFLIYYEYMLTLADKYSDKIQIAFKPHPLLKNRLELMWGKKKTVEYYEKWKSLENGLLNDGAYEDLFLTSDAIIHDCGSFIGEYLVTGKPAMYLTNGHPFDHQYNNIAQKCLSYYYIGQNKDDIELFIKNLILGVDPLEAQRNTFVQYDLLPQNGKLASENILNDLVKELIS